MDDPEIHQMITFQEGRDPLRELPAFLRKLPWANNMSCAKKWAQKCPTRSFQPVPEQVWHLSNYGELNLLGYLNIETWEHHCSYTGRKWHCRKMTLVQVQCKHKQLVTGNKKMDSPRGRTSGFLLTSWSKLSGKQLVSHREVNPIPETYSSVQSILPYMLGQGNQLVVASRAPPTS